MRCTFCVTEEDFDALRFDEAVALLDRLCERNVRTVVFGGGEPFTWPGDVLRLATEAKARGMTVQIGTNGVALPEGFAEIDILVNNAGITADNLLVRLSLDDWERVLRVNLTGTFAVTRALTRGMMRRRWGRIISVSSAFNSRGW